MEFVYTNRLGLTPHQRIAATATFYNLGIYRPEIVEAYRSQNIEKIKATLRKYVMPGTIYEK